MHEDGEVDTRAAYTVLCVASLLNILTPELTQGTATWIASCQTFEGGFGAEPFNEAHGGYGTFYLCVCFAMLLLCCLTVLRNIHICFLIFLLIFFLLFSSFFFRSFLCGCFHVDFK